MDICTGGEMFFHLGKVYKFNERDARFYFAEILEAFEYLHDQDFVFRDVKPENILLDIDGHIKLTDFGLSKRIRKGSKSHSFCGSPEYMCPEILTGKGHNRSADLYCLGAFLFELMTGTPPFYSTNQSDLYKRIINDSIDFSKFKFSPSLENLLKNLLQKDPANRI